MKAMERTVSGEDVSRVVIDEKDSTMTGLGFVAGMVRINLLAKPLNRVPSTEASLGRSPSALS
jgi:hypothetical protein